MPKVIFVVIDGLGDEEISDLGGKTPLDFAQTPNLDNFAREGMLGALIPVFYGAMPTSEEGHFALFGYDPKEYNLKRGILTALGAGLEVDDGDVAMRGNFSTVKNGKIMDRRAGRINDTEDLVAKLNGMEIEGVRFFLKPAGEYRLGVVMKGQGLSSEITDGDPHYAGGRNMLFPIEAKDQSIEARFTAKILNEFLSISHKTLSNISSNLERDLPANYILLRGASKITHFPKFEEKYGKSAACIAGKILYKQIGHLLGMDVLMVAGADGTPHTNLEGKFKKAKELDRDFVFLHIKAADSLAEDGRFKEKADFLEKIDTQIALLKGEDIVLVVTSDHSTCSLLKSHCKVKIPFLIWGKGSDDTKIFSEKECINGSLGEINQKDVLEKVVFKQ